MVDLTAPYVTFKAEEAGSTIRLLKQNASFGMQYSQDKETWTAMTTSTVITLTNKGDEVYIRGKLSRAQSGSAYTQFRMTGKIAASGNGNALWDYINLSVSYDYCGSRMFEGCTSLTTAPALPATELMKGCYYSMFSGCTSLITTPELPATTLTNNCYYGMFNGCSSLTTAPALPATELAS